MSNPPPMTDDTPVWDVLLSLYRVPAVCVALDLDIFESLEQSPASPRALAGRLGYSERALLALLPMLMNLGFLHRRAGDYHLTQTARQYMLKNSPFYWGGVFRRLHPRLQPYEWLLEAVRGGQADDPTRPADGWEGGHMGPELAREVTAYMHGHSIAAATGMARLPVFAEVKKLLDAGGGSGCFAITLAKAFPQMSCTVMDLPEICTLAEEYIQEAGVADRVDITAVDMFRQSWPEGYDALFFSNIFHDWSLETCAELATKTFQALPAGGRIFLHEMLLDDNGATPLHAVAFSLLMAMRTRGQQFTFGQLETLLSEAGFQEITCRHSHGYFSLVMAKKP